MKKKIAEMKNAENSICLDLFGGAAEAPEVKPVNVAGALQTVEAPDLAAEFKTRKTGKTVKTGKKPAGVKPEKAAKKAAETRKAEKAAKKAAETRKAAEAEKAKKAAEKEAARKAAETEKAKKAAEKEAARKAAEAEAAKKAAEEAAKIAAVVKQLEAAGIKTASSIDTAAPGEAVIVGTWIWIRPPAAAMDRVEFFKNIKPLNFQVVNNKIDPKNGYFYKNVLGGHSFGSCSKSVEQLAAEYSR